MASAGRKLAFGRGYHNNNYLLPLPSDEASRCGLPAGAQVKVRVRRQAPTVVERVWTDEAELLRTLVGELTAPQVLHITENGAAVHTYLRGTPLEETCAPGAPVPEEYVAQIGLLFRAMLGVDPERLPLLPAGWPEDFGSLEFFRDRVRFAQTVLSDANQDVFGELFRGLHIPPDAMTVFGSRVAELTPRRFGLLHTDLHRGNLLVGEDGGLVAIDWEHAMVGDPLYDLATHLCRSAYPEKQQDSVRAAWERSVGEEYRRGADNDLYWYVAYERAQSVYPDIIRAARSLGALPEDATLHHAVIRIENALLSAADPLQLSTVPSRQEIRDQLLVWHTKFGPGCGDSSRLRSGFAM